MRSVDEGSEGHRQRRMLGNIRTLLVFPDSMRESVVVEARDLMGHFTVESTVAKTGECFWFPKIRRCVKNTTSKSVIKSLEQLVREDRFRRNISSRKKFVSPARLEEFCREF